MAWNDAISTKNVGLLSLILSDNTLNNWLDTASSQLGVQALFADNLAAWADAHAKFLSYNLALADSEAANWADSHQLLLAQRLALSDNSFNAADGFASDLQSAGALDLPYTLSDSISFTLTDSLAIGYGFVISDYIKFYPDAAWKLDSTSGGLSLDSIGENDLTVFGSPSAVSGKINNATSFDATNTDELARSSQALSTAGGSFAVWGWFRRPSATICTLFQYALDASNIEYQIFWNNLGVVSFKLGANTASSFATMASDDAWHLLVCWYDANTQTINARIDNGAISSAQKSGALSVSGGTFHIGSNLGTSGFYTGIADAVGFSRQIPDQLQLDALWSSGNGIELSTTDAFTTQLDIRLSFASDSIGNLADSLAIGYGFVISENVFFQSDSISGGYGLLFTDSFTLTDAIQLRAAGSIVFSDTINNWGDSVQLVLGQNLSFADSINNLADAMVKVEGQLVNFTDNLNNLADSAIVVLGLSLSFSDSITLTDSLQRDIIGVLDLSDNLNVLTDSLRIGYGLIFKDSINNWEDTYATDFAQAPLINIGLEDSLDDWQDSLALELSYLLQAADSIAGLGETLEIGYGLLISDVILLTDSESQILELQLAVSDDAANLADSCVLSLQHLIDIADSLFAWQDALQAGYRLIISDQLALTDSETHVLGYILSLSDDVFNLLDSASFELGQQISLTSSLSLNDSLEIGYGLLTSDQITLSDSILNSAELQLSLTDNAAGLDDSIALELGMLLSLTDSFVLTDSIELNLGQLLELSDSFTLSDSLEQQLTGVYTALLTDSLDSWNDSIELSLYQLLAVNDDLNNFSDSILIGYGLLVNDDLNNWADSFSTNAAQPAALTLGLTDSIEFWQDSLSATLVHLFEFSETYVQSDSLTTGFGLLTADSVNNFTDSVSLSGTGSKEFSDSFTFSDDVTLRLDQLLLLSDSIDNLNDSYRQIEGLLTSFDDSIDNLLDSATLTTGQTFDFSDSLVVSDSLAIGYGLGISDVCQLSDSARLEVSLLLKVADNADNLADSITLVLRFNLELSDSIEYWLDSAEISQLQAVTAADTFILSDSIQLRLHYLVECVDTIVLTDSCIAQRGVPNGLELSDNLNNWQDSFRRSFRSVFRDRVVNVPSDVRTFNAGFDTRLQTIQSDDRTVEIEADNRTSDVAEETRSHRVPAEDRVMIIPEDDPVPPGDINND